MTIPGIDFTTAATLMATIGRIDRFASPRHLVGTMRSPGPLRAFGQRIRARRNDKIATVAVARKLACLTWQLLTHEQDYIYERPALTFRKLRQLELAAGAPKRHNPGGRSGPATPDTPAQWATEREAALDVEERYRTAVADWKPQRPPSEVT